MVVIMVMQVSVMLVVLVVEMVILSVAVVMNAAPTNIRIFNVGAEVPDSS